MPKRRRPSKGYKKQVREIIDAIDEFLPFEYVEPVKLHLAEKGMEVADSRIINVKNKRAYDLEIAMALKRVAEENKAENLEQLASQLGLVQ